MESLLFSSAACVQFEVKLGAPEVNLQRVKELVTDHGPEPGTLYVLPELWATGFDYEHTFEHGRQADDILLEMQAFAAVHQVYFAGSLAEIASNGGNPFNSLYLVGPGSTYGWVRKQHLFSFWREDRFYQAGTYRPPIETPFGPVGGLVCYDLRFPGLAGKQVFAGSRLLVICAQWPQARVGQWRALLRARAIENQVFIVAANGCGTTGDTVLGGSSMVLAPDGTVLTEAGESEMVVSCILNESRLEGVRDRFCSVGERPWLTADSDKVISLSQLSRELGGIRRQGSKIAFTNGCFDILHAGHVSYLEHARRCGDILVVGLNSDSSVRALKGTSRPVNSEQDRARVLAALGCVDYIVLFEQETPLHLINAIVPDVLVKGADWDEEQIVGALEVKAAGGRVERVVFEHDRSTSAVIEKIQGK